MAQGQKGGATGLDAGLDARLARVERNVEALISTMHKVLDRLDTHTERLDAALAVLDRDSGPSPVHAVFLDMLAELRKQTRAITGDDAEGDSPDAADAGSGSAG